MLFSRSDVVPGRSVLQELVGKTAYIVPNEGQWKVYYLGFARSGWTVEAQQYALAWLGRQLLDLKQVDQDLADWTV